MAQAISKTILGTLVALATVNTTAQVATAQGFTGDFAPEQWTLFNNSPSQALADAFEDEYGVSLAPFNGSFEFDAPGSVTLFGSNQSGVLAELPREAGQDPFTCQTATSNLLFLCDRSFTSLYVTVPEKGEIFFDWEYISEDIGENGFNQANFDLFGYHITDILPEQRPDRVFVGLSDGLGAARQTGSTRISVEANDVFMFSIGTIDNQGGRALTNITNFSLRVSEPDVDVPTSVPEPASGFAIAALAGLGLGWTRRSKSVK